MILSRVTGNIVATVKNQHLQNNRILVVQPVDVDGSELDGNLTALDTVDAGIGDLVLVMKEGGSARIIFENKQIPLQAVIVAVVDQVNIEENHG